MTQAPERFLFSENYSTAIRITFERIAGVGPAAHELVEQYDRIGSQWLAKESSDEATRAALLAWHADAHRLLRNVDR
jgi:hypothetical protein